MLLRLPRVAALVVAALAGARLTVACGGNVDHSYDPPVDASDEGKGRNGQQPDGGNGYHDPQCPDAGPPQTISECSTNDPIGTCSPGSACYPVVIPPQNSCEAEVYGTECLQPGSGTQGSTCGGTANCAPGYVCLITGGDTQCAKLCDLKQKQSCPAGFVCGPIDVPGFAACL